MRSAAPGRYNRSASWRGSTAARGARVARGARTENGRVVESWTLDLAVSGPGPATARARHAAGRPAPAVGSPRLVAGYDFQSPDGFSRLVAHQSRVPRLHAAGDAVARPRVLFRGRARVQEAEADLRRGLLEAGTLVDQYGATRTDHFIRLARVVADLPKLKAAVETGDRRPSSPWPRSTAARLRADFLLLTGRDGAVLGADGGDAATVAAAGGPRVGRRDHRVLPA